MRSVIDDLDNRLKNRPSSHSDASMTLLSYHQVVAGSISFDDGLDSGRAGLAVLFFSIHSSVHTLFVLDWTGLYISYLISLAPATSDGSGACPSFLLLRWRGSQSGLFIGAESVEGWMKE